MRLKSLEIHGFKSFADKTKLEFHEGVTGIVGPNGCGKSNIVDAMRWVLGETSAKALRGGEMADVIFNGTDRRSPLGMAEVTLTLSGCAGVLETEFDEVAIGRRVFRDGKSEYLVNKQTCRLKDIHNLLMGTGIGQTSYSIMEQGKIDMLLSSRPEDRRAVFEEAAGITKYKTQKKEALRKLDYTEANLVRIRDIIAENERQIRSLSRQASKAKRYQTLHTDVRTLELHLSHKQWRELRAEQAELTTSVRALRTQQDGLEETIEKRQAHMATARVEYQAVERRLSELQAELARLDHEVKSAQDRIEFNGERAHEFSVLIRKNEAGIAEAVGKKERQEADLAAADRQLEAVTARIEEARQEVAALDARTQTARSSREALNQSLRQIDESRSRDKSRLASLEATLSTNRQQSESDAQRQQQLVDEVTRCRSDESKRLADAEELRQQIKDHQRSIEEFQESLAELEQKYHQARRAAATMHEDLSGLHKLHAEKQSRLEVLTQLLAEGEGFAEGTQAVLRGVDAEGSFRSMIEGPLASHLEVAAECSEAIEAALGRRLQSVIVADLSAAQNIVDRLREDRLGEASLIAASELAKSASPTKMDRAPLGAIGWAIEQVKCDARFEPLVRQLLDGILVAKDLETALRLHEQHPGFAIATLAGDFLSREGILHGGRSGEESVSVLKMQTEVRSLTEVVAVLAHEVTTRQARRDQLLERVDQLEDTLAQARERLQQKRVASSTFEGKLNLVERDLSQLGNRIETLVWEQQEVTQRQAKIADALQQHEAERGETETRVAASDHDTECLIGELNEARTLEESVTESVTAARTQLAVEQGTRQNLVEQRDPMAGRLRELIELIERSESEIVSYRERSERAAVETAQLQEQIIEHEASAVIAESERAEIQVEKDSYSSRLEEGESELTQARREVQTVAAQRGREEVKSAQIGLALDNVERQCRDRYRTELEFFEPDSHALLLAIEERKRNGAAKAREGFGDDESDGFVIPSGLSEVEPFDSSSFTASSDTLEDESSVPDPSEPDWDFVEQIVSHLRTKLDSMGPVNMDAIEEFDELEEHYLFNKNQLEDLEKSKEELLRMISRINRDTRKMFSETFEQIRVNFREMFRELFGEKGKADLLLLDETDPLECGIDIYAKPPGKKLQSISLLSGGERSMTAVALLFAIYMVKPSPFCVLDELDAPLDEANITRFIRVLDRFIGGSQFVIVTHSKRTMSRADVMYGVSMEEFGVSKTVGVRFSKADEAVGLKTAPVGG